MKQSGAGKDMSSYSFDEYTVVKHVMYDRTALLGSLDRLERHAERQAAGTA